MKIQDLKIRLPVDVKAWLAGRAAENSRSMNGEILALLKATKQAERKGKKVAA